MEGESPATERFTFSQRSTSNTHKRGIKPRGLPGSAVIHRVKIHLFLEKAPKKKDTNFILMVASLSPLPSSVMGRDASF